uniref:TNFR-Cys domain-containing protein n=1 Tax=Pelodiscus sinensis TaxID=13735 RepID=K7F3B7_PELSI
LGTDHFKFTCEPCKKGTYSDTVNSCCKPWTKCENSGLRTIIPGNFTHNVECGISRVFLKQHNLLSRADPKYTTILAILAALGIFILILMTFFLHLCLWTLKKEKLLIIEVWQHALPCRLCKTEPPSHHRGLVEDSYSCQFPEEEHGGKTVDGKPSYCSSVEPH